MPDATEKNATIPVVFVGDAWWGVENGVAHKVAHHLLLQHPERDFLFRYGMEEEYPVSQIHADCSRVIIAQRPQAIVCGVGFTDIRLGTSVADFTRVLARLAHDISTKCSSRVLFCAPPQITFSPNTERTELARRYGSAISHICGDNGFGFLKLESQFNAFIHSQSKHSGTLYPLHMGNGALSPFGQMFVAHSILRCDFLGLRWEPAPLPEFASQDSPETPDMR